NRRLPVKPLATLLPNHSWPLPDTKRHGLAALRMILSRPGCLIQLLSAARLGRSPWVSRQQANQGGANVADGGIDLGILETALRLESAMGDPEREGFGNDQHTLLVQRYLQRDLRSRAAEEAW